MKILFFLSFVLGCQLVFCQTLDLSPFFPRNTEYYPGKLVSTVGDTLQGYFLFNNRIGVEQKIFFKTDPDEKKKETLKSKDFSYFIKEGQVYASLPVQRPGSVGEVKVFLPQILAGKFELYRYKFLANNVYPREFLYLKTPYYSLKLEKSSKRLEKQLLEVLKLDTESVREINKEKVTYENVLKVISNYNSRN